MIPANDEDVDRAAYLSTPDKEDAFAARKKGPSPHTSSASAVGGDVIRQTLQDPGFLERQPIFYAHHGEMQQNSSTALTLRSGKCFVFKGRVIHFNRL